MNMTSVIINLSPDDFRKMISEELSKVASNKNILDDAPLTINEVCSLLKISRQTLNKWRREGKLKSVKINSRVYFSKAEIVSILKYSGNEW